MWAWSASHGLWILVACGIVLFILLFARVQIQNLARRKAHPWQQKRISMVNLIILVVGVVVLLIAILSLASLFLAQDGSSVLWTPQQIQTWLLEHGVVIVVIMVVSYLVYRFIGFLIPEVIERSIQVRAKEGRAREEVNKRAKTLSGIFSSALGAIIAIVAVFMILSELGIDIAPLLAGAGVVGIAVGFGAQSLVKDIFSGIFIILEDQYGKGDVVQIAGISGLVEDINLRRTILRDQDGAVHSVPNGEVRVASNYTKDFGRVNLSISVAYGEDLDRVIAVLNRIGKELGEDAVFGRLITVAPQVLYVEKLGDSGIDIKIKGETKPSQQWAVTGELRKRIKKTFDAEGIEIPWPHIKLYYGQNPGDKPGDNPK